MNDLASWLLEQIADDERLIRAEDERLNSLLPAAWVIPDIMLVGNPGNTERMLAECAAKRARLRLLDQLDKLGMPRGTRSLLLEDWRREMLAREALPYADRPGYREEWRP